EGENELTCPYQIIRKSSILEAEGHHYFLQVQNGKHRGQSFALNKLTMIIGRRGNSDIVLEDETISRRHCQLEMDNEVWQLTDLDSRNGTYVNGVRIRVHDVKVGDSLKLGDILLSLKVE
ncbi:MAG: FHA domain-containing protein, partial [Clostridia bacterium]|nr:FHA domain-containing protein [Clostridia bacterium]